MTPRQTLKKYFGFENFRAGQLEIINAILNKQDALAILHTGGGKSICFQIPGLMLDGITLVISPLISLMKDQVDALLKKNIAATYINSSLSKEEIKKRYQHIKDKKYIFVYISPERLQTLQFIKVCQQIKISLVTIDEAHCISMWGHDFRPPYTQINDFIKKLTPRPILAAFTATATKQVRTDIIASLELNQPQVFLNSFKRSNLSFHVTPCHDSFDQELALFIILKKHQAQAGVIYTATKKKAEYLTKLISHYWIDKIKIKTYHAGLETKDRAQIQDQFLDNRLQIIVATNAFGMGVDKPNVRWVIHYQVPGNIENYYQEAGRAGRDESAADCYLLFNQMDVEIQKGFISQAHPDQQQPLYLHRVKQLQTMITYAQIETCRQQFILHYFDEKDQTCERCDHCLHQRLSLSREDKQYAHLLSQLNSNSKEVIFTQKLILLISVIRPLHKKELLRIPGIGLGWLEKWYNLFHDFTKINL